MGSHDELRKLPKIDRLLEAPHILGWTHRFGRDSVVAAVRASADGARERIQAGESCPAEAALLADALVRLEREGAPTLRPVINATGTIIHSDLGRAPLSEEALIAMQNVARGYSSVELDLDRGEAGARSIHCSRLLSQLTGAEDGLVVNNGAAAAMLVLSALCRDREVVASRGQLLEISGGFRIADAVRDSGARLIEVGTANCTYARDYEQAVTERTGAFLTVHRSNFKLAGYAQEPRQEELARLARSRGLILIDDLGSGALLDTASYGLAHEPTVQERVQAGADLVLFSGDKLLGGPQAGCIVGRKALIEKLRNSPLLRALRADKMALAGLEATLRQYLRGEAAGRIPIWGAMAAVPEELEVRAVGWSRQLGLSASQARVLETTSTVGGESLPGLTLPTRALAIRVASPEALATKLRIGAPPVVGRVIEGHLLLDPRTVAASEDGALVAALRRALESASAPASS